MVVMSNLLTVPNGLSVILPSGNARQGKAADQPKMIGSDCPKGKALEIGSGSCRSKADSRNHERNPLTEKGNFNIENNTAGSVGAYIDI